MIVLRLDFLAGRFSATPWGKHVNEGVPEWPPSPWRLLRAIVASWKRACPTADAKVVSECLRRLAATPPSFVLPPATVGHARHFMPDGSAVTGSAKNRNLVFDTFVAVDRTAPLYVAWGDVELSGDEIGILQEVVQGLPFLGRAESWCDARVVVGEEAEWAHRQMAGEGSDSGVRRVARPLSGSSDGAIKETIRLLCPVPWPAGTVVDARHPLLIDTTTLRSARRRLDPPGSQWVAYERPAGSLEAVASRMVRRHPHRAVEVARYALDGRPLPSIKETVTLAERIRHRLQGIFGRLHQGTASQCLSGHAPDGTPLRSHLHAMYLPTDEDQDGRIDHVTIVARGGFPAEEQRALERLRVISGEGATELRAHLVSTGTIADARQAAASTGAGKLLFARSRTWRSATPFLLSRYPRRGAYGPEEQLVRDLALFGHNAPIAEVTPIPGPRYPWTAFRRWRSQGPGPAITQGFGFRVAFAEPIDGPVAVGYGAHFGLGQFVPVGGG